ncbi:6-phosphogluconolactonase [Meinhardsimonia xiamenensis]|jgi:6-phosphogluconolactonase|nr:6-phosphogluconolactonase [Meinhardsimonia xiamenensis]
MKLVEYPDREMLAIDLANLLAGELNQALMTGETASFAVPGGTTPAPIFDALCAADLPWERVHVMPTDERWVPEDDARSNARLIRDHLLVERAARAEFISFFDGSPRPEEAAEPVGRKVAAELPLSIVLLGMGQDMHTASLFPDDPRLAEALDPDAPPVLAVYPPSQPEPRLTLTGPVLTGAMSVHVVITGEAKRRAIEEAERIGDPMRAPVALVLDDATVHWAE